MIKDKILIIEQSDPVKHFLKESLEHYNFDVLLAKDSFDGLIKMKNFVPDIAIMDYALSLNNKQNFFEEKSGYKTIADIPMILFSNKVDKESVLNVAKYKITKFFSKPIKIDILLKAIQELLKKDLNIDQTPCQIDTHLNDDILFIEVASGFNKDRIDSLKYKIKEIKDLYKISLPKILIILVDIKLSDKEPDKLYYFMANILKYGNPHQGAIKVLTTSKDISEMLSKHEKFAYIEVTDDINKAMDSLSDSRIEELLKKGWKHSDEDLVFWSNNDFNKPSQNSSEMSSQKKIEITIVDDDIDITNLLKMILVNPSWSVKSFKDGLEFVNALKSDYQPDLLFLDLMMPNMNGFEVLDFLKKNNRLIKTIVFSSLSQKETVKKVLFYGIKSYIVKPVNMDIIMKKVNEILSAEFI